MAAEHIGQEGFRGGIAVQDIVLAALLEIDHELHRDPRAIGPLRIGRVAAIAAEIPGIRGISHS